MAEKYIKDLTAKSVPSSTDLFVMDNGSGSGSKINYDQLADAILNKLTSKTFANQVGGSSAATLLAQLATLNSNINTKMPSTSVGITADNVTGFLKSVALSIRETINTNEIIARLFVWTNHTYYVCIGCRTTSNLTRVYAFIGNAFYLCEHNNSADSITIYRVGGTAFSE